MEGLGGIPRSSSAPPEFFEEFARDIRLRRRLGRGSVGGSGVSGGSNVGGVDDGGLFGDWEGSGSGDDLFVGDGREMLLGSGSGVGGGGNGGGLGGSRSSMPIRSVGAVGDRVPPRSFSTTELGVIGKKVEGGGDKGGKSGMVSSQSVLERIQEDFPRTPSPVHELLNGVGGGKKGEGGKSGRRRLAPIPIPGLPKEFTNVTDERLGDDVGDSLAAAKLLGAAKSTDDIPTRPHMSPPKQHRRASSINWSADLPVNVAMSLKKPIPRVPSASLLAAAAAGVAGAESGVRSDHQIGDDPRQSPPRAPSPTDSIAGSSGTAGRSLGMSGSAHYAAAEHAGVHGGYMAGGAGGLGEIDDPYRGQAQPNDQYLNAFGGPYPPAAGHAGYVGNTGAGGVNGDLAASLAAMNLNMGMNGAPGGIGNIANLAALTGVTPEQLAGLSGLMNAGTGMNGLNGMAAMQQLAALNPANLNFSQQDMKLLHMAAFVNAQQQVYATQISNGMMGPNGTPPQHMMNGMSPNLGAANPYAAYNSPLGGNGLFPRGGNGSGLGSGNSHRGWDQAPASAAAHHGYVGGMPPRGRKLYGDQYRNSYDANNGAMRGRGGRGKRHARYQDGVTGSSSKMNGRGAGLNGGGSGAVPRSALLDEFRATSASIGRAVTVHNDMGPSNSGGLTGDVRGSGLYGNNGPPSAREWELKEIKDHIVEFSTDQYGSRFIQQKLESASPEDVADVLAQATVSAHRLMTDVFGNYVVQKLLDHGGEEARKVFSKELQGRMLAMSLHMYGCRVVQKLLEVVDGELRTSLVNELDGHVLKCIRDQNGNHVIQKCVELVDAESVLFIVNAVKGQTVLLAEHSYGCRVVQRILEHGAPEHKGPVMKEIMNAIPSLIRDQYGNYVIQHVVEHGSEEERKVVIGIVRAEICELSRHKFASNVVERCLEHLPDEQRTELIEILIVGKGAPHASPLNQLVHDQYGNYVVQRLLDVAQPSQQERIANILRSQVGSIKKFPYGKHIIARLENYWNGVNSGDGLAEGNGLMPGGGMGVGLNLHGFEGSAGLMQANGNSLGLSGMVPRTVPPMNNIGNMNGWGEGGRSGLGLGSTGIMNRY